VDAIAKQAKQQARGNLPRANPNRFL